MHACQGRREKWKEKVYACSQEGEQAHAGSFISRVFKGWGLGEGLNIIFISFILMSQNETYSLNFICPGVWLTNGTNWISTISLPE